MLDNIFDLIGRKYCDYNRIALPRYICERSGSTAYLCYPLVACRIDVEPDHAESGCDQSSGVDFTHQADTDQTDRSLRRHIFSPCAAIPVSCPPVCGQLGNSP